MYLTCAHCGCEFLASKQQTKRQRDAQGGRFYCSLVCQHAGQRRPRQGRGRYHGICETCGQPFRSVYPNRKFCNLRCYMGNAATRERLRVQALKAANANCLKLTGKEMQPRIEVSCLNCATKRLYKPSLQRKYCNARCYRQYMAKRFDRWIAAPQNIALPQGYDEFLTQTELPCLIEGCDWVGQNLGNHVNFTHGITAEEFKRAAGFNKTTGLCTPAVSEMIASRLHLYQSPTPTSLAAFRAAERTIHQYRSLEGREHHEKALALIQASPSTIAVKVCQQCGKEFQPAPMGHGAKFCTIPCRDLWYAANKRALRFWLNCAQCHKDFQGHRHQQLRVERGYEVFCSFSCRSLWVWQHKQTHP